MFNLATGELDVYEKGAVMEGILCLKNGVKVDTSQFRASVSDGNGMAEESSNTAVASNY